jgi:hypothetical protein
MHGQGVAAKSRAPSTSDAIPVNGSEFRRLDQLPESCLASGSRLLASGRVTAVWRVSIRLPSVTAASADSGDSNR